MITTYKIEMSADEINVLLGLIDLAVKAGGLQVAQNAVILAAKLRAAAEPPAVVEPVAPQPVANGATA